MPLPQIIPQPTPSGATRGSRRKRLDELLVELLLVIMDELAALTVAHTRTVSAVAWLSRSLRDGLKMDTTVHCVS